MSPKLGDSARCKNCGEAIEYIGPYWRHVHSRPRHIAGPAAAPRDAKGDTTVSIEKVVERVGVAELTVTPDKISGKRRFIVHTADGHRSAIAAAEQQLEGFGAWSLRAGKSVAVELAPGVWHVEVPFTYEPRDDADPSIEAQAQ